MKFYKCTHILRIINNYLRISTIRRFVTRDFCKNWILFKIVIYSLFYNSHTTVISTFEACLQPCLYVGNIAIRKGGFILIISMYILISMALAVQFYFVLPYEYYFRPSGAIFAVLICPYLVVNVIFNHYMANTTEPGKPNIYNAEDVSRVCAKCIEPKPPRSHHCSICGSCVLKMDHHCPWLNNCVGHYNHRYFFQFMMFMLTGSMFSLYFSHSCLQFNFLNVNSADKTLIEYVNAFLPFGKFRDFEYNGVTMDPQPSDQLNDNLDYDLQTISVHLMNFNFQSTYVGRRCLMFIFVLSFSCVVGLFGLLAYHIYLISIAQTCIEMYSNNLEQIKQKKNGLKFRNIYNFGIKRNWLIFFGLENNSRRFIFHVLLPSTHLPDGDGIHWHTNLLESERALLTMV